MKIPLKYPMGKLPPNFNQHVEELTKTSDQIEGYLTPKEVRKKKIGDVYYESD